MRKSTKQTIAKVAALVLAASALTACDTAGGTGTETTTAPADTTAATEATTTEATTTEAPIPTRDLGGIDIVVGNWWEGEPAEPVTKLEQDTQAYRDMIQEQNNFTISVQNLTGWGSYMEFYVTNTMAGDTPADVYIMDQQFVSQPLANNLMYDLATIESFDFSKPKWNEGIKQLMTKGDHIYGMSPDRSEPRGGIFFNKRLLEEAGIDPEEPYDLQASGEWTWDKFEEYCAKLTYDKNNDGVMDSYALSSFSVDYFKLCAASNGAEFIGMENGKYVNKTSDPAFLEAMQYGVNLIEKGYEMPQPPDSNWDYFIAAFHDAKVAMTAAEQHKVSNWADMEDDWGFVMFPAGPKGDMVTVFADNINVMPSCLDAETADKIAFGYDLYSNPTPGYEEDDDWMTTYYTRFRDERAVDETLTLMYEEGHNTLYYLPLVYGTSYGDIAYDLYALGATPAEKIEAVAGTWESLLNDANAAG